ncbi:TPA: helix-turn-helix domain-containing protein [Enterococcus faecalis]|nr:helix-turn-helix domain-containing protein [Enterococcus faecalis]
MENLYPVIQRAQAGDLEAMTRLILQFNNLLLKLSKNYDGTFDEDCYQILSERFIKAVHSFDLNKI